MTFRNPFVPPVTKAQLKSVGKSPDCLYWSATFHCWCLSGDWVRPYATTERLLSELGLTINPESMCEVRTGSPEAAKYLFPIYWVCVGYDTKKHMNEVFGYLTDTASQAEATCRQLHPNFEIYYTCRNDQWEVNR